MTAVTRRIGNILDRIEEIIMATLLAFMTCLTFVQVVLRYVFNTGLVWSLEATTYSFAWLVLVGMSYGVRTRTHIAIDLVAGKLPGRWKHYVALLAVALCLLYSGLMFYGAYLFVDGLYTLGHMARDVPLHKWTLTVIMPIAFVLLAFRFLQAGRHVLQGKDADMIFRERDTTSGVRADSNKNNGAGK